MIHSFLPWFLNTPASQVARARNAGLSLLPKGKWRWSSYLYHTKSATNQLVQQNYAGKCGVGTTGRLERPKKTGFKTMIFWAPFRVSVCLSRRSTERKKGKFSAFKYIITRRKTFDSQESGPKKEFP